jgi:glutamate racemase
MAKKSKEEIVALSIKNTDLLLEMNCKLIVVACNTATTNAIRELRAKYDIPFIGIEPAIKPAATNSKNKKIGILATGERLLVNFSIKRHNSFKTQNHRPSRPWISTAYRKRKMYSAEMTELLHSI